MRNLLTSLPLSIQLLSIFWLLLLTSSCSDKDEVTALPKSTMLSQNWQIEVATSAYEKVVYQFYKKGRTDNDADLSGYRFTFRSDNSYAITDGKQSYSGTWKLTQNDTMIEMDGQDGFKVLTLTEASLVVSFDSEEMDEKGNLLTVTTTYTLIPVL
ncbi:MAG: hypothetical protein EAZ91_25995 [Cytophagales bacterium]|nr:MAG: hypothetical protein EAZ91_25995 [Cytophagales bacterium]